MDTLYETYANTVCSEIPVDYLKRFILGFLYDASKDMGCTFDKDDTVERVYYLISTHYNHLPLMIVASGFKRGALGQFGSGRLVPKTIFGWMGEINQYYMTKHSVRDNSQDAKNKFKELVKSPFGKATNKKIDWWSSGALSMDDWDKVPLKELAEMIGRGQQPTLEIFGIKNHLKEK